MSESSQALFPIPQYNRHALGDAVLGETCEVLYHRLKPGDVLYASENGKECVVEVIANNSTPDWIDMDLWYHTGTGLPQKQHRERSPIGVEVAYHEWRLRAA